MLNEKLQQPTRYRQKEYKIPVQRIPLSHPLNSKINNFNNERPLKTNSENLSFKGLSLWYKPAKTYSMDAYKALVKKYRITDMGDEFIESIRNSKFANKMVKFSTDDSGKEIITIKEKAIPHLVWNDLTYPLRLPGELLNGMVELLGKIKPLENTSKKILKTQFFKDIRQQAKTDAKVNSLRGIFELDNLKKLSGKSDEEQASIIFQQGMKSFDPTRGNYDTKHERALTRVMSGMPPAIFLANDAYNLSRLMDDDPNAATKEKKSRFKQEVSRVGWNAYLQLITFGALSKYINNSTTGVMLITAITTVLTEGVSRLTNGKHISRLTPEEARAENEKNKAPEAAIKPDLSFKAEPKPKTDNKEKQQKPLLSFDVLMKASGMIIAAGYGLKLVRGKFASNSAVKAFFQHIDDAMNFIIGKQSKAYNKLTQIENFQFPKEKFDKIVQTLRDNGFADIAEDYEKFAKPAISSDGKFVNLGPKDKKIAPVIKFVKAPVKFVMDAITLPYRMTELAVKSFSKKKEVTMTAEEAAAKMIKGNIAALQKSIENIGPKALREDFDPHKFQEFVKDNRMKAFNVDSLSQLSNAELSNLAKAAGTAATLWFLMTDNYNMVMLKSNGNNIDGAETKFKERAVQETSRLFYQALLIDLFNSTFSKQYHKSLLGASWVTMTNTTISEWLNRTSVGIATKPHTRDELIQREKEQNEATGLLKGYYTFMRRLTGKRPIETYNVVKKNGPVMTGNPPVVPPSFQQASVLQQMIKG